MNGTDSCSARCGVVEKRRSPRVGLRARRSGPHAQHAAEASRRGPASASAGAGRRGHQHDMQCTLDPDDRATGGRYSSGYRPPARPLSTAQRRSGPPTRRRCETLHSVDRSRPRRPVSTSPGRCHGISARTASTFGSSREGRDLRPLWGCQRRGRGMPMQNPLRRAHGSPASPDCSCPSRSDGVRPRAASSTSSFTTRSGRPVAPWRRWCTARATWSMARAT